VRDGEQLAGREEEEEEGGSGKETFHLVRKKGQQGKL
jgi:hypothetical protein